MKNNTEFKIIDSFLVKMQQNIEDLEILIEELRENGQYDESFKACKYLHAFKDSEKLMVKEVISATSNDIKEVV